MQTFKDFFNESVYKDFYDPPLRAKFQIDDIVIVRDNGKWLTYQSKKTLPYINQIGRVVAYKNIPGAYSKFAVEFFSDKSIHGIHGHFLYGPFKDVKVAEKYSKDPNLNINPVDIVKPGSKVTDDSPLQINERLEKKIVEVFCNSPIGFNWLPTPLQFFSKDGKITTTVLAVKPIKDMTPNMVGSTSELIKNLTNSPLAIEDAEFINLVKTNYIIARFNSSLSKKLRNLTYTETFDPTSQGRLFFNNANSPYAIYFPYRTYLSDDVKAVINYDDITNVISNAFGPKFLTLTSQYLSKPSAIKEASEVIDTINNTTSEKLFLNINSNIEIKNNYKYAKGPVNISEVNKKWFVDCDFSHPEAEYNLYLNQSYNNIITNIDIPDTVHNLNIQIITKPISNTDWSFQDWSTSHTFASRSKRIIQDLTFLPPKLKSLSIKNVHLNSLIGLPNIMDNLNLTFTDLTSLENFPEKVTGNVNVGYNNLENFKGSLRSVGNSFNFSENPVKSLEGLPDAKNYVLSTLSTITMDDIKKYKQKEQYTSDVDKSVVSTFDDLLDEL